MRVLLDLNIILDVLLNRAPWVADSAATWDAHRAGEIVAHVAAFSVPTVFYVVRRQSDLQRAHDGVRICLESLEIAPVSRSTLELARQQTGSDYEERGKAVGATRKQPLSRTSTGKYRQLPSRSQE